VHGIAASEEAIVLTTDRGLYRSVDGAAGWTTIIDTLPAHLEAGPLVHDPLDPATLYAGFSLCEPYKTWHGAPPTKARSRGSASPASPGAWSCLSWWPWGRLRRCGGWDATIRGAQSLRREPETSE
jgi:hypothetical protein